MKRLLWVGNISLALFLVALTFQACGRFPVSNFPGSASNEAFASKDLDTQTFEVLQKNCASCHDNQNAAGTSLTYITDLKQLANSTYVTSGDPSASLLFQRVASGSMPPSAPLKSSDEGIIYAWVKSLPLSEAPPPVPTPTPVATATPVPTATPNMATFTYISQNILQPKCVKCHGASGGYAFSSYASTLKAVVSGNPAASLLYTSTSSKSMPKGGTALTSQELLAISNWIKAGAPNN